MDAKKKNLIIAIGIYLLSTAVSFLVFSMLSGGVSNIRTPVEQPKLGTDQRSVFNDKLPRTEECPLNGVKYSKQQRGWWEKHRPLGVMIENHQEARPQSGMTYADVTYEAVAEGGITRFLNVFYCQDAGIVGPVRSARTYFLDFVSEYGDYPLYAHVGGANCNIQTGSGCANGGKADAIGQIGDYRWRNYNDMDGVTNVGLPTMWRDYDRLPGVASEHTMYSTTTKLWELGKKRGLTEVDKDGNKWDENFIPYKFKDDASSSQRPKTQAISFAFWAGYSDYAVAWNYDPLTNLYMRTNGGKPHIDKDNDMQLSAKNVVILFMTEGRANDGYDGNLHMLYGTKGTGKAMIFMDGKQTVGTWSKKNRTSRTVLRDASSEEIKFDRGRIWFEILGTGTEVIVK